MHGFFYYKEQEENVLTFDKIVARMSLMDYNKNRTDVLFARSAKTCAVVDTGVGIAETTTTLADMDLTAIVKVL